MFVAGDEGHLTFAATLPGARGRGAQSALLAERIAIAARRGLRTLTAETGVDGAAYRNLVRAGFVPTGTVANWDSDNWPDAA